MQKIRIILLSLLVSLPSSLWAATAIDWDMEPFEADLHDKPSLQNGMRLYVNYCLGCHSLKFQRYQMTVDFLGIPHETALEHLIFSDQKIIKQAACAIFKPIKLPMAGLSANCGKATSSNW